ncbi:uncharacterized protein LOC143022529 isoform X2 [Oratosquilla oratoria]|uniref:uncharacterized protein LOC143022529 isoform X2 n=1 Tax=Oratosquilla oratoria TaxID=337810 RepID=UPI003F7641B6
MESHKSRVIAVFVIILQVLQVNAAKPGGVPSPPSGYLPPVTTTPAGEPCVITRDNDTAIASIRRRHGHFKGACRQETFGSITRPDEK